MYNIYNARNNKQDSNVLPTYQPFLLPPLCLLQHASKEYALVEKLHTAPAKISLWNLMQTSTAYHKMVQEALKLVVALHFVRLLGVAALFEYMHTKDGNCVLTM